MLPSWLTQRGGESPSEVMHAVLGTPLRAPLMSDQEEALLPADVSGELKRVSGVFQVWSRAVGYAGGERVNPTYQEVCSGTTGHTEVVRVVWSTPAVDFSDLLKLFWECHDPTQGNRQGNDTGTQYRSAIYTTTDQQMTLAQASRTAYQESLNQRVFGPITTKILADQPLYFAEPYHQQYLAKPGSRPYRSAMPTQAVLGNFIGSNYRLPSTVWTAYD